MFYITITLCHTGEALEIREPVQDRPRRVVKEPEQRRLGPQSEGHEPRPRMIYNGWAEVEDIKIGFATKLK